MRNKKLVQNRLSTLQGQLKKLDMQIHRGGTRGGINEAQRTITETIQDIIDIIEREVYESIGRTNTVKLGKIYRLY